MPYKAFISYSHEADGEFADELHDAMEKLAKPWIKRRARRVALDRTAMSAGSSLADTIEEKLADSEWLVLLAAPASAQSKWVDDEIDYWAANKSMDNVVVALTGGDIAVDSLEQRVDWANSTALSDRFRAAVGDDAVPLYEDLRPFKGNLDHANLRNAHFRDEVAKIVGRIEGEDPGELASEDKRQYKHGVRLRRAAEVGLVVLTAAAVVLGVRAILSERRAVANEKLAIANEQLAKENELTAIENARIARENELTAIENEQQAVSGAVAAQGIATASEVPDLGALLALESMRIRPTVDAFISVVNSVVTATNFNWRVTVDGEPIITAAASNSDGSLVAMGNEHGDVWVMSPDSPDPIDILVVTDEQQVIADLAFTEGDSALRVLDLDGYVTTWDMSSGDLVDQVFIGGLLHGAVSGDGSTIAVLADEFTILVFDAAGSEIATQDLEIGLTFCELFGQCVLAISDDGTNLAWVENDGLEDIVMKSTGGGEPSRLFTTPKLVTTMAFTPGGETLVVAEDGGTAHLLPATASSSTPDDDLPDLEADADFLDFSFATSEDDVFLRAATAHLNGSVKFWELAPEFGFGDLVGDLSRHNDEVRSVAYTPDGASIVSGGWDGDIISWSPQATAKHGTTTSGAHETPIVDVTFVGPGSQLASVSEDGGVSFWDAGDSGSLTFTGSFLVSDEFLATPSSIDASPGGDVIAVGVSPLGFEDNESAVLLFDLASGEQLGLAPGEESPAQSVAFSPDGRWLAAGFAAGPISVWDIDGLGGDPAFELPGFATETGGVAFSGDSRLLAAGDGDVIRVWDVISGAEIVTVTGNQFATATAVALNADGSRLAWGDDTRLISLWDTVNDVPIGQDLEGHREEITDLQFVESGAGGTGTLLASTSSDAETRVWSVSTSRLVARILAHANDVSAVDVSESGNLMVTSGLAGDLWVGSLDPESWVDAACALAGRNMSAAEWAGVQGDEPYVKHCGQFPSGQDAPEDAEVWTFEFTGVVGITDP